MATQGGPAKPVSVQTGGRQQGGPALPVAVVSDGRATEGGPAMAVYAVTSGPVQGGPAVPIVVATGAQANRIAAGPAVPVYVVSGSLSGGTTDPFTDSYSDTKAAGAVVGSNSPSGVLRRGTDTESKLSNDNGKLRMAAMAVAGWNREGVAYGPYTRANGLALVVRMNDGDVQANDGTAQHLAIGFFTSATPANALTDGNAIILADNGVNGGMVQRNGSALLALINSLRQVELYIVVVLRATGAAYYLGSVTGANEIAGYTSLRPMGLDTVVNTATVYAAVWQRNMTSGGTNSTRVHALNVAQIAAWAQWYGTAQAADTLTSSPGSIAGRTADGLGGTWSAASGGFTISASGATGNVAGDNIALIDPGATSGLIKATIVSGATPGDVGLIFRAQDANNFWMLQSDGTTMHLYKRSGGVYTPIITSGAWHLSANSTQTMQVIDDGNRMRMYLDQSEVLVIGGQVDTSFASNTSVGLRHWQTSATTFWQTFEAHPRTVTLPATLDLGAPYQTQGATTVATETFAGGAADIAGLATTTGGLTWARTLGSDTVSRNGSGTGVVANVGTLTLYTVPWSSAAFADVAIDSTPPGAGYGSGNNGHAGVVLWQDANNWLATYPRVNDDQVNAAEIEVALCVGGSTSVVKRVNYSTIINHGVTTTIRMTSDGANVIIYRGTEAAFCFALTDLNASYTALTFNRVGIYVGSQDTGSTLDNFIARSA
jgi:hypothetical protein